MQWIQGLLRTLATMPDTIFQLHAMDSTTATLPLQLPWLFPFNSMQWIPQPPGGELGGAPTPGFQLHAMDSRTVVPKDDWLLY